MNVPTISHSELTLTEGWVPETIPDCLRITSTWQISYDAFRMQLPSSLTFWYRRGHGTVFARQYDVPDEEVSLFFNGSVRGAIAWLAGMVPLHASAVLHKGSVYAFTGSSGEGKSTLVAALAKAGFQTFSDDVLVVDPKTITALPGHKRIKLWQDALALTGHAPGDAVRLGVKKFFIDSQMATVNTSCCLRRLYVLRSEEAASPAISPLIGAERFNGWRSAYYRAYFGTALLDPVLYLKVTMQLAASSDICTFTRSRDVMVFERGVEAIAADICQTAN